MKRIVYAILATVSGLVLLFSYRTSLEAVAPTDATASTATTTTGASSSGASSTGSTSTSDSSTSGSSTTTTSGYADGTYTGGSANTRYGPVQVQITVSGGEITAVEVIEYPASNRRDIEINERAIPILVDETLSAQTADVDMVSGATYTSDGYIQSLQSALDEAQS